MLKNQKMNEIEQGTTEWLELRKTKITASDAATIMGVSPWKNKSQLYYEKVSIGNNAFKSDAMQRGIDLEPIARDLFILKTWKEVHPAVLIRDWAMASLDGISACGKYVVEIKCPGPKDHAVAVAGKVPDHYYPQLQHQMYVADVQSMYYFSFDGVDGVIVEVQRDQEYIKKMIDEELKFYQCVVNRTPPEPGEGDYIERNDNVWYEHALRWKSLTAAIKELEEEQEELKKQLVFLSGESNTKGAGISLCQIQRKGNIAYDRIPELQNVDLEKYRKASINSWRITQ